MATALTAVHVQTTSLTAVHAPSVALAAVVDIFFPGGSPIGLLLALTRA